MGLFTGLDISGSALVAERLRMQVYSNNLANWRTVRESGRRLVPYGRRTPIFASGDPEATGSDRLGVRFVGVLRRESFVARPSDDPENDPDAVTAEDLGERPELAPYVGHRLYPDVNVAEEMVDMISASRAYEANITAIQLTRSMMQSALQVLA
ncbi:MAG: flagellar basal body rod protein FlgC [Planctomycetota bacterium]|jgi:flagellar basal-body rod protein FlgC